jgi:hypothetical protein
MTTEPKNKFGRIYLVRLDSHLKLGFTRNLDKRLRRLGEASVRVELIDWVKGTSYIEKQLNSMLGGAKNGLYGFEDEQRIIGAIHSVHLKLAELGY